MREPRVETGERTMTMMAVSLAFTAGGILLCYLLSDLRPVEGRTMKGSSRRRSRAAGSPPACRSATSSSG